MRVGSPGLRVVKNYSRAASEVCPRGYNPCSGAVAATIVGRAEKMERLQEALHSKRAGERKARFRASWTEVGGSSPSMGNVTIFSPPATW